MIISKKALIFKHDGNVFHVKPLETVQAPEWIKYDPLYGWALKDGTISVSGKDSDLDKPVKEKSVGQMNRAELEAKAEEVGISKEEVAKAGTNKDLIQLIQQVGK